MVTSGLAGEVLQVRDRSGRDWCGRHGKLSLVEVIQGMIEAGKVRFCGVRCCVERCVKAG